MKKRLKKMLAVICLLTLVFTFTIKPKKADAVFAEMTIASWLAAGGTLATVGPIIVGLAGAAVIGAAINSNWDAIEEYGGIIYDDLIGQGKTPEEIYTQDTDGGFSVTASPEFIKSASRAVDTMPETIVTAGNFQPLATLVGWNQPSVNISVPLAGLEGNTLTIDTTYKASTIYLYYTYLKPDGTVYTAEGSWVMSVDYREMVAGKYRYTGTLASKRTIGGGVVLGLGTLSKIEAVLFDGATTNSHTMEASYVIGDILAETTYNTADMFGAVADNAYQRELAANAALSDNQVLKITQTQDLTNATLSDMADTSAANYDESRTQTGILSNIWNTIRGIPANIAAAGVAASTAINTKMTDLWEDAGAIWTGLADTATGIRADITAKMGALQDAMAGGIDNVRSGINDMIAGLNAGIDTIANNMASWGQLTLDGIDAGIGTITSGLTNIWEKITTGITEGVGSLTGTITTAMDDINTWITDFPTTMLRVFVPPNFDFMQPLITATTSTLQLKFGPLETLPNVFKNIFGAGKSIYDIEITVLGHTYKIVPIFLKPVIDGARPFLTGAINLMSLTILYRRYKGNLVIPA